MKIDTIEDLEDWINELDYNYTEANKELAFKCIQKALEFKDLNIEFEARYIYLKQCCFQNYSDEAVAMFPWFLKYKENKDITEYQLHCINWSYKWIITRLQEYSNISLLMIENVLKDMEQVYIADGAKSAIIHKKMVINYELGKMTKFLEFENEFLSLRSLKKNNSVYDDCEACQVNSIAKIRFKQGNYKESIKISKKLIDGNTTCHTVPDHSYSYIALSNYWVGNIDKAENLYQKSRKKIKPKTKNLEIAGEWLQYLFLKNDSLNMKRVIENQIKYYLKSTNDFQNILFEFGFQLFCMLLVNNKKRSVKIKSEIAISNISNNESEYNILELQKWIQEKTSKSLAALDLRNGNNFKSEQWHGDMRKYIDFLEKKVV